MTIECQPKPELVYERRDTVEINAKKKAPYQEQIITSIDLPGKERAENGIESTNSIKLVHEEPKNEISNAESIEILQKKEKPLLASTKTVAVEVKATKKQPPKFEISKTQQITAEAQAVKTKESATEPQKPELSIASNTAEVSFEKNTLPKKEFTIDGQSELLLRRKKTEKTEANVGTEPPQLEISETKTLTAEEKKIEKQDSATGMEASTLSVITEESSFGYSPKIQAKPLLPQLNDSVSLTGAKSFGELQGGVVEKSMHIPAKPKPTLEIVKQQENLLIEAQTKPESEISSSVETLSILRQPKPENQISSEGSVHVLPKPKPVYVKTNSDLLSIEGNDANWYLQVELDATKEELKAEKEASGLLATQLDLKETLQQEGRVMKLNALKPTRTVSESVIRTKNTQNTEVQTADKVTLSTEKNELFIKGEKPSKDWIIDFDEDEAFVSEDTAVEKVKELFQTEYRNLSESVRQLKKSVRFGKPDADETETLAKLRKNQKTLADKMSAFEKTCNNSYSKLIHQFVNQLSEELDAVEAMLQKQKPLLNEPKVAEANKMFKPGWSVLAMDSINTAGGTFEGEKQPKSSPKFFHRWPTIRICFIGKSPVMIDSEIQMGEPRVSEYLQPEHTNTIVGDGSETEKVRKEAETLRGKLQEFDGMDPKEVEHRRGKSLEDIKDVLSGEVERNTKELSEENERLKQEIKLWKQEVQSKQEGLEKENNETMIWSNAFLNISDEVEKLKKLLSKMGGLNPGAEVPQCEDPDEYGRAEKLYEMTRLLKDLFIHVAGKSLTREVLDEAKKNFETLKEMYDPCSCKNDACAKLREEREAYIAEVEKALKNAERFLPSGLWEEKAVEMFLPSKPKTFSPSKPKKTRSFAVQTDIVGGFFKETEAERQKFSEQIENSKKETEALKDDIATLGQISAIQEQEGIKTEEANQKLLEQIKGLEEQNERLRKENKDLEERLKSKEKEFDFYTKDFFEAVGKQLEDKNAALKKDIEEKDAIIAQKDEELEKQKTNLFRKDEENTQLKLQNLINEPEEEQANVKKNDKKKEDDGKKSEKYKKEEEEAKKEMHDLMQRLKNTENIKDLKNGIAVLLDYAERRLPRAADKFELKDTEDSVKETKDGYGDDAKRIAQKNASGSFVHTVSALQKNVIEAWKKITVILKPKALPGKVLEEVTADEEEKKINREAERRKRAVVQEKDAEIAALEKKLEEMKRKLKQQVLDAKTRRRHIKGKTETNLSHETDVSPLYNFNDTSDIRNKEKRDDVRRPTRYETPETNKLRNRCANNYSRDSSVSHSKTLLKKFENSGSRFENYTESQIKSDKTFETLDTKGLQSFTVQGKSANFLGSIEEMKDEIQEDDKECMLPKLQKAGRQVLDYLNSDYWKNNVMWDRNFETQNKSVKEAILRLLEYIEKKNKRTPVLQKSVTEKKLKTPQAETKTRSRFLLPTTVTENKSGLPKNLKSMFDHQKSDGKTHYKKIEKAKINHTGRKKDKTE